MPFRRADAVTAAADLGYPVVLKAGGGGIAHKSDAGLVRIGVATADEVVAAYDDLVAQAATVTTAAGAASIDGIVVAEDGPRWRRDGGRPRARTRSSSPAGR